MKRQTNREVGTQSHGSSVHEECQVAISTKNTDKTKEVSGEFEKGKPIVRLGRKAMGLQFMKNARLPYLFD